MRYVESATCDRCGASIVYPEVLARVARVTGSGTRGVRIEADYCERCVRDDPEARVLRTTVLGR